VGGRPKDWHPVADKDPIPGDPEGVATLGRQLRDTAAVIQQQIKNLQAVAEVTAWDSDAGTEFRKTAKGTVGKLEAAFKRYDAAAHALGTRVGDQHTHNYASQLNHAQEKADAARKDAQDADGRKSTAQKQLDALTDSHHDKSKKKGLQTSLDTANSDIQDAKDRIETAKQIRDNAAKLARQSIDNIIDHDSLKDQHSFWGDLLSRISDIADTVATWCAIASLALGWIPIVGQALAGALGTVSMIAAVVSLACITVQYIRGEASLLDLGKSALGFLMMGVGKAFAKMGGKFASRALPRLIRASSRRGGQMLRRDRQIFNKIAGKSFSLTPEEIKNSLTEPFSEAFSGSGLREAWDNTKNVFSWRNWKDAKDTLAANGGLRRGIAREFSIVDPDVAHDLKSAKNIAQSLGNLDSLNKISRQASALTLAGIGITGTNFALDDKFRGMVKNWTGDLENVFD
jgi:hypothetical protein